MTRRVVVTGLGAVTALGKNVCSMWGKMVAGTPEISWVPELNVAGAFGGRIRDFRPNLPLTNNELKRMDPQEIYAVAAAMEALDQAGLSGSFPLNESAGVVISSGAGGHTVIEACYKAGLTTKMHPQTLYNLLPDAASGRIAVITGASGPNMAPVGACASGTIAIGEGTEIIRRGDADIIIAGASEAPFTELLYHSFLALGAVATFQEGELPNMVCKSFDLRRNGFVLGEGAGVVVLEEWEHAQKRGAQPLAEVTGYGSSNDAYHVVISNKEGRGPILAMKMALRKAGIDPNTIGYINAHGTGTELNDKVETLAVKEVFGDYARHMPMSSTKPLTGHLMGAAGAVEAVVAIKALEEGVLPPTINYQEVDPECDLDYVPNTAREVVDLRSVMSNSIGLGGHNAALIFSRV